MQSKTIGKIIVDLGMTVLAKKGSEHDIIWIRKQKSPQWCENRFWLFP